MFVGVHIFLAWLGLVIAQAADDGLNDLWQKGHKHIHTQERQLYYYYNNKFRGHSE